MEEIIKNVTPPAVLIAVLAFIIQSIFSFIQMRHNWKFREKIDKQIQNQYITSVLNIIDSLPIDDAGKSDAKINFISNYTEGGIPPEISDLLNE